MEIIIWKDCYSVGIDTFDDEHHVLVRVVNDLYAALRAKKADEVLQNLLAVLVEYTEKHFTHEEQNMDKYNFPGKEGHKEQHQILKDKIVEYQRKIDAGEVGLSPEIMSFLRGWLLDHIVETDKHFGEFLLSNSIYDCGPPAIR